MGHSPCRSVLENAEYYNYHIFGRQTNYLLDRLLRHLEKAFLEEGGIRERMTWARLRERARQSLEGGQDSGR